MKEISIAFFVGILTLCTARPAPAVMTEYSTTNRTIAVTNVLPTSEVRPLAAYVIFSAPATGTVSISRVTRGVAVPLARHGFTNAAALTWFPPADFPIRRGEAFAVSSTVARFTLQLETSNDGGDIQRTDAPEWFDDGKPYSVQIAGGGNTQVTVTNTAQLFVTNTTHVVVTNSTLVVVTNAPQIVITNIVNVGSGAGDNLGNHVAVSNLLMNGNEIWQVQKQYFNAGGGGADFAGTIITNVGDLWLGDNDSFIGQFGIHNAAFIAFTNGVRIDGGTTFGGGGGTATGLLAYAPATLDSRIALDRGPNAYSMIEMPILKASGGSVNYGQSWEVNLDFAGILQGIWDHWSTLADGDVLTYRASDNTWHPAAPGGGGGEGDNLGNGFATNNLDLQTYFLTASSDGGGYRVGQPIRLYGLAGGDGNGGAIELLGGDGNGYTPGAITIRAGGGGTGTGIDSAGATLTLSGGNGGGGSGSAGANVIVSGGAGGASDGTVVLAGNNSHGNGSGGILLDLQNADLKVQSDSVTVTPGTTEDVTVSGVTFHFIKGIYTGHTGP